MMQSTDYVLGSGHRMLSDSPAALDMAVVAPVDRNEPADDRDLAKIRTKSGPEPVPGAGQVVRSHDVKDPVPHETALLRVMGESLHHRVLASAGTGQPKPAELASAGTGPVGVAERERFELSMGQ